MQTAINYFKGLDKTTVKQLVTVSGVLLVPVLTVIFILMVKLGQEIGLGEYVMASVIALVMVITGIVGKEYF